MGPSANAEIKALASMTSDELTSYANLWKDKNELARKLAVAELVELREETNSEVEKIKDELDNLTAISPEDFENIGISIVDAIISGYKGKTEDVVSTAAGVNSQVISKLNSAAPEFTKSGINSIDSYSKGAASKRQDVVENVSTTTKTAVVKIGSFDNQFYNTGQSSISSYSEGAESKRQDVIENVSTTTQRSINTIESADKQFYSAGQNSIASYSEGASSKRQVVITNIRNTIQNAIEEISSLRQQFYSVGQNSISGFIEGMRSKINDASREAANIALAAYRAAMQALDINSPSRLFMDIGKYSVLGLADGLKNYAYLAENSAFDLCEGIVDTLNETIKNVIDTFDSDLDMTPVIRPVINLDDINKGIDIMNDAFKHDVDLAGVVTTNPRYSSHNDGYDTHTAKTTTGKTISFVQNNYSPKALSRIDIYRHTKNQFTIMREAVSR